MTRITRIYTDFNSVVDNNFIVLSAQIRVIRVIGVLLFIHLKPQLIQQNRNLILINPVFN